MEYLTLEQTEDTEELEKNVNDIFPLFKAYLIFYKSPEADNEPQIKKFLRGRLEAQKNNPSIFFIAKEGDNIAGFAHLHLGHSSLRLTVDSVLHDLYVVEIHRNKGIATRLIEECKAYCQQNNIATIELQTQITNEAAQSIYRKAGFVKDEEFLTYTCNISPLNSNLETDETTPNIWQKPMGKQSTSETHSATTISSAPKNS